MITAVTIGLTVLGLYVGTRLYEQASSPALTDPNRIMATRVLRLGQALERHATRAGRPIGKPAYPLTAEFPAFVAALPEGEKMLTNPWGAPPQDRPVSAGGATGLPTAAQHREGADAPTINVPLGAGTAPGAGPYTARTFGALVYDHDPKTDTFVLYGIGEREGKAVVVAETDSDL